MDQPVFPSRWEVGGAELIAETIGSHIWKVVREDGSPAIVKAMKPVHDVEDELRGVHFLRWREGEGAVRLLDIDGHRMLLEYAGDRLLTQTLVDEGDVAATAIAAEVLATIHAQSSRPAPRSPAAPAKVCQSVRAGGRRQRHPGRRALRRRRGNGADPAGRSA